MMQTRAIGDLRRHPSNAAIYDDTADDALIDSVRRLGVLEPLLITADNRVISGHRRLDAARTAGLPEVPVIVRDVLDEIDILVLLLDANKQRQKTNEQIGREAQAALKVERERAQRRQVTLAGTRTDVPDLEVPLPQGRAPQARDLAGQRLHMSGSKVERAAAVVETIDRLADEGKEPQAEALRTQLNETSVQTAYDSAVAQGFIVKAAPRTATTPPLSVLPPPPRPVPQKESARPLLTLDRWGTLSPDEQQTAIEEGGRQRGTFNKQKTDHIEWAQWSWNPVTGCKHDCSYCYARDIAARFYPQGFAPTFLPDRLGAPAGTPVPVEAAWDVAFKNVFTCSMADLFGRWVPRAWIEAVLAQVRANPQWNFLFLTKFALRLQEFDFPPNAWVGTTVDAQARVPNAEKAFSSVKGAVKWLSCEPMLERLTFSHLDLFDWVVVGGASASTQTPEFRPPRAWVDHLEAQARAAGCLVYEKTNLLERRREFPGQQRPPTVNVPDAFKMGYLQRDVLEAVP